MVVRHGPSDDVLQMGTAIQLGGNYFWDDNLVENEKQFIYGVYKISTGMLPHQQTCNFSGLTWDT